jgi:ABC-2 type transport system permease protein
MKKYWYNFKKYRHLLFELVGRDIKVKYKRSYLGLLWTLLNPLLMMIVLTMVFSTIFNRDIANFPVYLLTGKIMFDFFSQATNGAMSSVVAGSALLKKVYIPKYIFPLSKVIFAFVNLMFSLIALLLVMIVTKTPFNLILFMLPFPLIYIFIFAAGMGLILATYTVFFRDIMHLYGVILMAWMYFTPLFYPAEIITDKYIWVLKLNPLFHMITMLRNIVLYNQVPTVKNHVVCLLFGLVTLVIGLFAFYKKQDKFILSI